jgi:endonuclease/exonuclease/phosphatase family metal-dependent hydrolase
MARSILLFIFFSFLFFTPGYAQKNICVAFYNTENLFDTIDDPHKNDNEFLPTAKHEWNSEKYLTKISHLGKAIKAINEGKGPDVIGLAEVENKPVLADLVLDKQLKPAKYSIVHYESPDERSIDNALLYKSKEFRFISSAAYRVDFPDHPAVKTRDILLVKLEARNKTQIIFLVNHFPSRLGGEKKSEPKRFRAASILRHICDSIDRVDPNQPVVIMGDFNDEPVNRSIDSVFGAQGDMKALANSSEYYNAMYPLKAKGEGTLMYRKDWNLLDQFLVNRVLVECTTNVCFCKESAAIFKAPWLEEKDEKFKGAPLRTFAGPKYTKGYSDHFPVFMYLLLKK